MNKKKQVESEWIELSCEMEWRGHREECCVVDKSNQPKNTTDGFETNTAYITIPSSITHRPQN